MKDFINLLNQYPSLSESKVSLSDLGVSHRVFFNWKDKGIIDYEHKISDQDIANNITRKKIVLNAFEALWVLIIKELRSFNLGLSTIGELKTFLFSMPDYSFIKAMSDNEIKEISRLGLSHEINTLLSAFNPNIPSMVDYVQNNTESNKIYYSQIGILLNSILLSGQSPSIFVFKKPSDNELKFEIFNPELESIYHQQRDEDYRTDLIDGLVQHSVINIPIRPLFEIFFEKKALLKYSKHFGLYTPSEIKILNMLKSRDFDKIIIHKNNDNQITIESSSNEQVLGQAAVDLRKVLGLKEYQRAEVIYRNNKHLVVNNTTKQKVDLGNP